MKNSLYALNIVARSVILLGGLLLSTSLLAAQVAAPYTSGARYNMAGQLTGTLLPDPDGAGSLRFPATRNTYNANGLLERTETGELIPWQDETVAPAAWSGFVVNRIQVFQYDQYGRKTIQAVLDQQERATSLVQVNYDTKGRKKCKAVRLSAEGYRVVNFNGLPDACYPNNSIHGRDRVTEYTYNTFDDIETEKRAVGTALEQTYVTNTYLNNSRLLNSQTDANGNRTELTYDAYNRLHQRRYPSSSARGSVNTNDYNEYRYDANGNMNYERKRNGKVITYGYDNHNRMILKDLADNTYSQDVDYDYDLRGLTLSSRFASGSSTGQGVINVFNGFGSLTSSTVTVGGVSRQLSYLYDDNGNRERITHPDNTYFTYGFDGINRVNAVRESAASTLLTVNYANHGGRRSIARPRAATTYYDFDDAGRLEVLRQNLAGSTYDLTNSFTYNPANQVAQMTLSNNRYHYSGNENRTGAYLSNGLNQYTHVDGQPLGYDDFKGNLTNDGSLIYIYDDENRLVSTSGAAAASFTYDPLGRLFDVTINGAKTQFLYDGDALVAEYVNGAMTRRYVHGDQVDEPWVQYNSSAIGISARRYLHANHQGSIVAHSNRSGSLLSILAYDSYGIPDSGNVDRFGYTGQIWFKELGLFHYKARMYSPKLGRFLQTDPIFYADQMNMYAYVGNDPLNLSDPTGLAKCGNIEGGECEQALNDADQAKADVDNVKAGIDGITTKMANGDDLSESEQGFVDAVGEKFGSKFTSEKGLGKLSKGLGEISSKIGVRGEGMTLMKGNNRNADIPAYMISVGGFMNGNKVYLNNLYFSEGNRSRSFYQVHEAGHLARFMGDTYIRGGNNSLKNTNKALGNADTYACLIYPASCGY